MPYFFVLTRKVERPGGHSDKAYTAPFGRKLSFPDGHAVENHFWGAGIKGIAPLLL